MTGISIVTDEIALTLFERHGRKAIIHVQEQIGLSLERADWPSVKSWRYAGAEIDKLARVPMQT
jgi:hypothetical protein